MRRISFILLLLPLAACAVTEPVVVIEPGGHMLNGTTTAALSGGHFQVSDGAISCSGVYNALDQSPTLFIPTSCSDGRTGMIEVNRDPGGTSGQGTIRLSDGTLARFGFGSRVSEMIRAADESKRTIETLDSPINAWNKCVVSRLEQIDDGKADVDVIAEKLSSQCVAQWKTAKQAGCANLDKDACELFSARMDANLRSQDIQIVLAARAKRAHSSQPY
jgi:hypothetical protein